MYARVTRVKGDPAKLDQTVERLKTELIPIFEQQPGYLGVISVANRETGEGATTTYWDSMENLKASEGAIFAARDKFTADQGAELLSFHRCEVAVVERKEGAGPRAGAFVRATTLSGGDPARLDDGIQRFREQVAPLALSQPGCLASVLLVDRENNVSFAVSSWETAEQREAADSVLSPKREEAASTSGGQARTQLAETTYADLKVPVQP